MLARKIMLFTMGIILLGSCVYLACLVIYNREYLHPTSIPRLISLMGNPLSHPCLSMHFDQSVIAGGFNTVGILLDCQYNSLYNNI
jgi:hypothetical protein